MDTNKRTYSKKKKEKKLDVSTQPVINTIGYGFWFTKALRSGKVQFWQEKEIYVFFTNRGLSDKELETKYDEILKLY